MPKPQTGTGSVVKKLAEAFIAFKAGKATLRVVAPVIAVSGVGYYLYKKFGSASPTL